MTDQSLLTDTLNASSQMSISALALDCLSRFDKICDDLQSLGQETAKGNGYDRNLVFLAMQDARVRFKAWGNNIAAFRKGHLPSSLEFRLREAPEIRTRLLQVLDYLREYLNDGLSESKAVSCGLLIRHSYPNYHGRQA